MLSPSTAPRWKTATRTLPFAAGDQRAEVDADAGVAAGDEREGEVHPREQRAGVHPRLRGVPVARRRLRLVERLADLRACPRQLERPSGVHGGGERADGARDELERRLDLRAVRVL